MAKGWWGGLLGTVEVYKLEGPREHKVLVDWGQPRKAEVQQEGQLQQRELEREFNFKEEKVYLKCAHLEQVQHCTDLPYQVTLLAHTKQDKMGPEFRQTLLLISRRGRT